MTDARSKAQGTGGGNAGRILVVEDDDAIAELLTFQLTRAGYAVEQTGDGEEAVLRARETLPDLVILDWMIEGISGLEVCRQLRHMSDTASIPVIMLTARGEEEDRVRGLEVGADDYVTKPFSPREMVARVAAVLRRLRPGLAGERLRHGELEMDTAAHRLRCNGETIDLGPTEFRLLRHFLEQPGRVFSRAQLLDAVWGHDSDIEFRTVYVYIRRLRRAITEAGGRDLIRTVRSAGYALDGE